MIIRKPLIVLYRRSQKSCFLVILILLPYLWLFYTECWRKIELRTITTLQISESASETTNVTPAAPLYFETESGFRNRLQLEENIMYSSKIKEVNRAYFNKREGYNESFADSLPFLRELPDFRPAGCDDLHLKYKKSTSTVSVVMHYRNELLSLLLRTIYTTIRAIPPENFEELILIDDASNLTAYSDLRIVEPLITSFTVPVRFWRFEENKGLVFCRSFGAREARGDVILILDSHVEMAQGFVEPLLNITDNNYKAIAAPIFDFIETFKHEYWHYDGCGFGYDRYFGWIFTSGPHDAPPWRTPGILGGAFAATKRRLEEIEYFGRGMVGWGGENIELSLKNWMCDGEIYYVPCSRCLHFAAKRFPNIHGNRIQPAKQMQNIATVAKSFLDDAGWAEYLRGRPNAKDAENNEAVAQNKEFLQKLNCSRTYDWVRDHLMQNIESFDEKTLIAKTLMYGEECVYYNTGEETWMLRKCPVDGAVIHTVRLSKRLELRYEDQRCVDYGYKFPKLTSCHFQGGNQKTKYSLANGQVAGMFSGWCLTKTDSVNKLSWEQCIHETHVESQMGFYFKTVFHPDLIS